MNGSNFLRRNIGHIPEKYFLLTTNKRAKKGFGGVNTSLKIKILKAYLFHLPKKYTPSDKTLYWLDWAKFSKFCKIWAIVLL